MSDYRKIRLAKEGYRKLRPQDTMHEAHRFKSWLQQQMAQPFEGKTVVVTHHAPSAKSLFYSDTITNPCYASPWDDLAEGVDLWVHGHTHRANDYPIGDCRVVINPKGYPGQDTGFDPELLIEL
jgi:predicted phosphodiesterase